MPKNKIEDKLLEAAIGALQRTTNFIVEKTQCLFKEGPATYDAALIIRVGEYELKYNVEIKPNINKIIAGIINHRIHPLRHQLLIVTNYVTKETARDLKALNIQFIDTAGNAYINYPPIYIFIAGNKRNQQNLDYATNEQLNMLAKTQRMPFRRAGLRVIFVLLCDENIIYDNYRKIAIAANAALGTVGWVFYDLLINGHLIKMKGKKQKLIRRKKLFEHWVKAYADKLRPKQLIGRFITEIPQAFKEANMADLNALWGGEMAAGQLTKYLNPEIVTIYARKPINDLIIKFHLLARIEGKIEIREQFWNFDDEWQQKGLVHPILIYADLVATGDPRNVETARIIYDQYVEKLIGEN
jgi:hypothetical protein